MAGGVSKVRENEIIKRTTESRRKTSNDIREYIDKLLHEAKLRGEEYIDLISGIIHKQLGLKNSIPAVCFCQFFVAYNYNQNAFWS